MLYSQQYFNKITNLQDKLSIVITDSFVFSGIYKVL